MTKLNPKTETLPDGEESFFHHPGGYLFLLFIQEKRSL